MKLAVEKLSKLMCDDWEHANQLLHAHWQEVAHDKELMKLDPNLDKYIEADFKQRLHIVVMRDDGDKIVGYSVHFLTQHPHYRGMTCAEDDVHYLIPEFRGTGNHELMRTYALRTLKERGVQFVTARVKVGHEHDKTLRNLGYGPVDMVYGLDLTKWPLRPSE